MASVLGAWSYYYKYYSLVVSALLTWYLFNNDYSRYLVFSALSWLVYSVYLRWPVKKIEGGENYNAIIVGAGFSGLDTGRALQKAGIKYVILEKSNGLGGTWYDNRYPGAACDVMSHLYSLSELPNPWWSRGYSGQKEIQAYLQDVAEHYGITEHIRFNKKVTEAQWSDENQKWTVTTESRGKFVANFLINGAGGLHVPKTPDFRGKYLFKGKSFHTAQWPKDYHVEGRNVAIIGTGASAVQMIPAIADKVKKLTVFQRTPGWVPHRANFIFPAWMKWLFAVFPPAMTVIRYLVYLVHEALFPLLFCSGTWWFKTMVNDFILKDYDVVKDPEVRRKLKPTYESGCKRLTPHACYAETYNKTNVTLITDQIEEITENGVKTTKMEYDFDTIIYATGFDLIKSMNPYKITGVGEKSLAEDMGDTPAAYNGVVVPNYPNFFLLLGPNTALGHNTVVFMIECQVTYIVSCLKGLIESGGTSMSCRDEPMAKYHNYIYKELGKKVWATDCKSWYKNEKGIIFVLWPNGTIEYWWKLLSCNLADYKLKY